MDKVVFRLRWNELCMLQRLFGKPERHGWHVRKRLVELIKQGKARRVTPPTVREAIYEFSFSAKNGRLIWE